jgi:hypothetical protein
LTVVGVSMSCGEALRLIDRLWSDPSSALASSAAGWDFPMSREASAVLDLYDLTMAIAHRGSKKRVPLHAGRPYDTKSTKRSMGNAGGRTNAEVIDILDRARRGTLEEAN